MPSHLNPVHIALFAVVGVGVLLALIGLFTSVALLLWGLAIAAFVPLVYVVVEIERHGPRARR
jgi:hypothetical protein